MAVSPSDRGCRLIRYATTELQDTPEHNRKRQKHNLLPREVDIGSTLVLRHLVGVDAEAEDVFGGRGLGAAGWLPPREGATNRGIMEEAEMQSAGRRCRRRASAEIEAKSMLRKRTPLCTARDLWL